MDLFDVLTMIGGLSLFLFGMSIMGSALERRAGSKLQSLLGRLTSRKIAGLLTGLGVTAVIQSSSATTVMVVGFVNSGLMTLKQAINVIMGANIGTTVTAWILSLGGIEGDALLLQLLKPTSFTPVLALVGIVLFMFCKADTKKDNGMILLGFAVLMFGMDTMTDAVSGLADVPAFQNLFLLFSNPVLGVLAGAVLTALIQSSSASVGILQALAMTGAVSYGAAIPIIMGQNIGTCITAILSSFGTNRNARRTALVHLSFNVIGTAVWLSVFSVVKYAVNPGLFSAPATLAGIAVAHSAFNVACTVLLLPMSGVLEKLVYRLVPDSKLPETVAALDERLLATPAVALERSSQLTGEMALCAAQALKTGLGCLRQYAPSAGELVREQEERVDRYEDMIGSYLVKLSVSQLTDHDSARAAHLLKIIGDLERISDHAVNLVEAAEELRNKKITFSPQAMAELNNLADAIEEVLDLTLTAFTREDAAAARAVIALEDVVDELKERLRHNHVVRMQQGVCTVVTGFIWGDILTDLERTSDHCCNVAQSVLGSEVDEEQVKQYYGCYRTKYIGE